MYAEHLLIQALIADRQRDAERERTYRGGPLADRPARTARRQRAPRRRFVRKAGEAA